MSISKQLKRRVDQKEPGSIFVLKDFEDLGNPQAVALELSRLFKKGKIQRLSKGKYFIPKISRFGNLGPSESQILEKIIQDNGGYFAGAMALNRIGVTTQIPAVVTIRGARSTRTLMIGNLVVKLYKQGNSEADYLDSKFTDVIEGIRLIRRTSDGSSKKTVVRIQEIIGKMSKKDIEALVRLANNERPFVRAILGAVLESLGKPGAKNLKAELNPLTKYKLGFEKGTLPNMENWGIV